MRIDVSMKTRKGEYAMGVYTGEKLTVLAGGKINMNVSEHIVGGKFANKYRHNSEYVDSYGNILKDCEFNSPSIAAQFVNGNSTNGYRVWKVASGKNLGQYLKENGLK
nr:DUF4357 domain-containing protein [uncultured Acetatifactor sp.]